MVEKFEMFADIPKGQHLVAEIYALWKKNATCSLLFSYHFALMKSEVFAETSRF